MWPLSWIPKWGVAFVLDTQMGCGLCLGYQNGVWSLPWIQKWGVAFALDTKMGCGLCLGYQNGMWPLPWIPKWDVAVVYGCWETMSFIFHLMHQLLHTYMYGSLHYPVMASVVVH